MADHGLEIAELHALPQGTELHYTNWPGRASVPVTLLNRDGNVKFADGRELYAFADELSREPRAGLGE